MTINHNDLADRDDAQLAKHMQRKPGAFARLFWGLSANDRAVIERRVSHGLAWLAKHETQGRQEPPVR